MNHSKEVRAICANEYLEYLRELNLRISTLQEQIERERSRLTLTGLATGEKVHLSASAGGAAFPEQGEDFISLCRSADAALYNVKQNGKAAFKIK